MSARVYICDSNAQRAAYFAAVLAAEGYRARLEPDIRCDRWVLGECDLVLVSLEIFQEVVAQHAGQRRPDQLAQVLVITAAGALTDQLSCLEAGADDVVPFPSSVSDVMARVRSASLRMRRPEGGIYHADGRIRVDLARREVKIRGRVVSLTPKEFACLALLVQREGRPISFGMLRQGLWGHPQGGSLKSLHAYIRSLRTKIESDPDHPVVLCAEPGLGYRWVMAPAD